MCVFCCFLFLTDNYWFLHFKLLDYSIVLISVMRPTKSAQFIILYLIILKMTHENKLRGQSICHLSNLLLFLFTPCFEGLQKPLVPSMQTTPTAVDTRWFCSNPVGCSLLRELIYFFPSRTNLSGNCLPAERYWLDDTFATQS